MRLFSEQVPVLSEALEFASMGLIPAGAHNNRAFREAMIVFSENITLATQDVLFDPQTSGGLLVGVSSQQAGAFVAALHDAGIESAAPVGEVIDGPEEKIWVN